MADSTKYYVLRGDKALAESMTKEQILAAITQAVEGHEIHDVDTGFVEKVKEQKSGSNLMFWVGTTAEYNAIATKQNDCFYILTDDQELNEFETLVDTLSDQVEEMRELIGVTIWEDTPVQSGSQDSVVINLDVEKFLKYRLFAITIASDASGTDKQTILAYKDVYDAGNIQARATIFDKITPSSQLANTLICVSYITQIFIERTYEGDTADFYGVKESVNLTSGNTIDTAYYLLKIEGIL